MPKITKAQNAMLAKHKVHHTRKHMAMMRALMRNGMTFKKSHNLTMKYIGK